jgi:hypothetical protein
MTIAVIGIDIGNVRLDGRGQSTDSSTGSSSCAFASGDPGRRSAARSAV